MICAGSEVIFVLFLDFSLKKKRKVKGFDKDKCYSACDN